jgi:hypothetical protein
MMRSRSKLIVLILLAFGLLLGPTTTPAVANSYPGLVEKEWYHGDDILNARIAIEVNGSGQGRFRLHLQCFYTDASGRRHDQACDFEFGTISWCDLTIDDCFVRAPADHAYGADLTWTGVYRTLVNNHTYASDAVNFRAWFSHSGYQGAFHYICTKKVTWHTGGSPTIGGYPAEWDWC